MTTMQIPDISQLLLVFNKLFVKTCSLLFAETTYLVQLINEPITAAL